MVKPFLANMEPSTIAKIVVVIYIAASTFLDFNKHFTFLDNRIAKTTILLCLLGVLYYNLHLGILMTTAFLIFLIQINGNTLTQINSKKMELFLASFPPDRDEHAKSDSIIPQQIIECDNKVKNELSESILDYSLDPKVKPYEVFVKMMTTNAHLESASNSAFL